jgi:nudix-type nucleoside diphosphatase (YffH/AdpP family)
VHDRQKTEIPMSNEMSSRVRLLDLKTLSDNHYVLRKARFEMLRRDGRWQEQLRESYDIGDGAAVLPVDAARGMVLLIRQFRWPVFEAGHPAPLIEAVAGKLDGDDPQTCVRKEAMEEAGVHIGALERVTHCFSSPGAVKERLSLFLAAYDSAAPRAKGGGHESEGEDIEVLEMSLDAALDLVARSEIIDAKTIILLQAAKLKERK